MITIAEQLSRDCLEVPNQPALYISFARQPDQFISHQDIFLGGVRYANALETAGIQTGEVVILILQHGEALVYAFFGCILHGAIPAIMPFLTEKLSPEQYRRSLAALFQTTKPAAVITYQEFLPEVEQAIQSGPGGEPSPVRVILNETQVASSQKTDTTRLRGLERSADDIALLQHSSGTTGLQKGVALSHRSIFNQLDSYSRAIQLRSTDVIVSWLPLYHDMGLIAGFLLPILRRIPLVLMSPFDWVRAPYRLFQAISRYRGTLTWLPNFAYNFCAQKVRSRDLDQVDLSTLRAVINCSEPMYIKSHQMFLERFEPYGLRPEALATCYAMAENVFAVTQGGIGEPVTVDRISQSAYLADRIARPAMKNEPAMNMLSAGHPLENLHLRVLDETRREVPDRTVGEIALQSDCMLTGYFNRPDATESAFYQGWYLTGDLGYVANGEVYITGRKKDIIIVGGKNIYPQDLENLASEVPGVHPGRVAAFGVFNEETGTEDVVVVAEADEEGLPAGSSHEEIANEIRQRVNRGSDIALRYVKIVPRGWLLKTSSGKVARSANRDKYLSESDHQG